MSVCVYGPLLEPLSEAAAAAARRSRAHPERRSTTRFRLRRLPGTRGHPVSAHGNRIRGYYIILYNTPSACAAAVFS